MTFQAVDSIARNIQISQAGAHFIEVEHGVQTDFWQAVSRKHKGMNFCLYDEVENFIELLIV